MHASKWTGRDSESNERQSCLRASSTPPRRTYSSVNASSQQEPEVMEVGIPKVSPDEGIQMPDKKMTIKRSKQQKVSVIALRTFPDVEYKGVSAGSIWLSMDDAEEANVKGGEIKCFSKQQEYLRKHCRGSRMIFRSRK